MFSIQVHFPVILSIILVLAYVTFNFLRLDKEKEGSPYPKTVRRGWTWLGNLAYFEDPWTFLSEETKDGPSMFQLANLKIVALPAAERDEFFNNRKFSLTLAYTFMLGPIPSLTRDYSSNAGVDIGVHGLAHRRLVELLRRERMTRNMPAYLSDLQHSFDLLGDSGVTDPFESVYFTFFRMSARTLCPLKVAEDLSLCAKAARSMYVIETTGTPATILIPWFMGPDRIKRCYAIGQFLLVIRKAMQARIKEGRCDEDPLQLLLDKGHTFIEIVQFTIGALFAATANTGHVASYLVCHMTIEKKWTERVREEFAALKARSSSNGSNLEGLSDLSLEDWETSMPSLALCLKETLRLYIATPTLRLNTTGADFKIGNIVVPPNGLIAWHINHVHLNPDVHKNPMEWDPERFNIKGAGDTKASPDFMAWGQGTHTCLGSRFAKFMMSLLAAAILTEYDLTVVDASGTELKKMPPVITYGHAINPPEQKVMLKYTTRRKT